MLTVDIAEARGTPFQIGIAQALAFRQTARGMRYLRRADRTASDFSLSSAERAFRGYAPNLWEEFCGLSEGLEQPLAKTLTDFGNWRLAYPMGCSALMAKGLYGRNYDFRPRDYEPRFAAMQPHGVHASFGFSHFLVGRLDGMNEHGLCVGLHAVNLARPGPGFLPTLIVRMTLDQCATTAEAVAFLTRVRHGFSYNYSLIDSAGDAAVVEFSPRNVDVRRGVAIVCTNHFQSALMRSLNPPLIARSLQRLPHLETWANEEHGPEEIFRRLNDAHSPLFFHAYERGFGTIHTVVAETSKRRLFVGIGGDATPTILDMAAWRVGGILPAQKLQGVLGGLTTPWKRAAPRAQKVSTRWGEARSGNSRRSNQKHGR